MLKPPNETLQRFSSLLADPEAIRVRADKDGYLFFRNLSLLHHITVRCDAVRRDEPNDATGAHE
jgi:hypothetical protein